MDLLFSHIQEKKEKNSSNVSKCDLKLYLDNINIFYVAHFEADYKKFGENKKIQFDHHLQINLRTGDINIIYKITNQGIEPQLLFRNIVKNKKNDFKLLEELTENGFIRGEKKFNYWGVNYGRSINKIFDTIYTILKPKFNSKFLKEKQYKDKNVVNHLYDLIVDFHLDIKKIKGHDSIYHGIQHDYPKKKWLNKNENKFLPAVLDSYGIKSKYLISELNINQVPIYISTLNYICKLFGENHLDYLKKIPWYNLCLDVVPNKKVHQLKNESEKKYMVQLISKWEKEKVYTDSFIYSVNKLLSLREFLEEIGYTLKFNIRTDYEFENLMEIWSGYKTYYNRGYKIKYTIPISFQNIIEEPIIINDQTFKPRLLLTEDDFKIEGFIMKNCMVKQFNHGVIYLFVSLEYKRKKVNIQYKKGELIQSYGKANTTTPDEFKDAIDILTGRFKKHSDVEWKKEKFDFLNKK